MVIVVENGCTEVAFGDIEIYDHYFSEAYEKHYILKRKNYSIEIENNAGVIPKTSLKAINSYGEGLFIVNHTKSQKGSCVIFSEKMDLTSTTIISFVNCSRRYLARFGEINVGMEIHDMDGNVLGSESFMVTLNSNGYFIMMASL